MTRLLTETADYNEDGSWGRMSEGWPFFKGDRAYDMYVFANCIETIPYGSYVLMKENCLRIHSEYIEQLLKDFESAGKPSKEESVRLREEKGKISRFGNRSRALKWW